MSKKLLESCDANALHWLDDRSSALWRRLGGQWVLFDSAAGTRATGPDLVHVRERDSVLATGLACQPLYQLTPLAYARRAHPLVKAQSLAQLQAASWVIVGPSVSGPVDVLHEAFAVRRMRPPRVGASCPDYASLLHLMTHSDLLGVLPHPALLDGAPKGQVVPLRLREALPRYEMHLFPPIRSRRVLVPVLARLKQQAAFISEVPGHAQDSAGRPI